MSRRRGKHGQILFLGAEVVRAVVAEVGANRENGGRRSLSTDDRRGGQSATKDTEREIEENNALRKKLGLAPLER
ncbi:hypothetical protein niasHS_007398 [Heterodera schachtii]|uniref:Transposase n=1 Tax=Heterodera schachtii TaxID=97005 RepID=A0ABD2JXJ9_HETSC